MILTNLVCILNWELYPIKRVFNSKIISMPIQQFYNKTAGVSFMSCNNVCCFVPVHFRGDKSFPKPSSSENSCQLHKESIVFLSPVMCTLQISTIYSNGA